MKKQQRRLRMIQTPHRDEFGGPNMHKLKNMLHRAADALAKVDEVPPNQTREHRRKIALQRCRLYRKACAAVQVSPEKRIADYEG